MFVRLNSFSTFLNFQDWYHVNVIDQSKCHWAFEESYLSEKVSSTTTVL